MANKEQVDVQKIKDTNVAKINPTEIGEFLKQVKSAPTTDMEKVEVNNYMSFDLNKDYGVLVNGVGTQNFTDKDGNTVEKEVVEFINENGDEVCNGDTLFVKAVQKLISDGAKPPFPAKVEVGGQIGKDRTRMYKDIKVYVF